MKEIIHFNKKKTKKNKKSNKDSSIVYANPDQYKIFISENKIIITNKDHPKEFLEINRKNCFSIFINSKEISKYKLKEPLNIFGILGIVEFKGIEFLIQISKASLISEFMGKKIYLIRSVQFITVNKEKQINMEYEKCWDYLEKLKKYLKTGFYFSYNYPLHLEFRGSDTLELNQMFKVKRNIYCWGYRAIRALVPDLEDFSFFPSIIQGYVGEMKRDDFQFVLISRRSFYMSGTRYNSRGIDNMGNVANYVESEQLLITNSFIFSFSQIRGSLPFYWTQKGVKAKIKIEQTLDINTDRFEKHVDYIKKEMNYENIVFFNLLGLNRGDENVLTNHFTQILKNSAQNGMENVFYEHVDFHQITKETDYSNVNKYIYNLCGDKIGFNIFEFNVMEGKFVICKKQTGIIRSNCLDCLDRTNAVQTKISYYYLNEMMKEINCDYFKHQFKDPLIYLEKGKLDTIIKFRQLWADNGDMISTIYAGTGATTSSVTRKGDNSGIKSIFDHGIKTISRFYLNNFDDDFKQEIINSLLHKKEQAIRHSITNIKRDDCLNFDLGIISIISIKEVEMIEISEKLIQEMLQELSGCEYLIFVGYISKKWNIRILSSEYLVYENFRQLFHKYIGIQNKFMVRKEIERKGFEIIVLGKWNGKQKLTYFNDDKVKLSSLSRSFGVKTSYILNDYSIELFALDLSNKSNPQETIQQLLKKYIDQYYDMIFIVGNVSDQVKLDFVHKNYTLIYSKTKHSKVDSKHLNSVFLLYSKKLLEKQLKPVEEKMKLDQSHLTFQLTMNCNILRFCKLQDSNSIE